jgi:hypothetical protein
MWDYIFLFSNAFFWGVGNFIYTGSDDLVNMIALVKNTKKNRFVLHGTILGVCVMMTAVGLTVVTSSVLLADIDIKRISSFILFVFSLYYFKKAFFVKVEVIHQSTKIALLHPIAIYLANATDDFVVNTAWLTTHPTQLAFVGLCLGNILGVYLYYMIARRIDTKVTAQKTMMWINFLAGCALMYLALAPYIIELKTFFLKE